MTLFRDRLSEKSCFGIFSKTVDSALVEATGLSGLDFIVLDTEHGPAGLETLHHHVRAARLSGLAAVIRVRGVDPQAIGAALDTGADGVQVPNINTPEQARAAIEAARFHPRGQRGVCRFVRAASFGSEDKANYFRQSNNKLLVLQVEGLEGVKNLDAILALEGFDVLFVGPYDLSQSAGRPGEVNAPEVVELIEAIAVKARAKGVLLGAFCDTPDSAGRLKAAGFNYLTYGVDINLYLDACTRLRDMLNG
jgi:4-hydroxy-2-oxoheptanedioate aldolase